MAHRPSRLTTTALTIVAAILSIFFVLPLLWTFTSSLRPGADIFGHLSPFSIESVVPTELHLENYTALIDGDFGRAVANSLFVSAVTVAVGLAISATAAFALGVLRFRGRGVLFAVVVLSFLIPFDAIAIPLSDQFRGWGLDNTYTGLVLPGVANGLAIFVLRQFFLGIPRELYEAARVDGLSAPQILWRIYVPLSRPALIGAGLMLFLGQWQAYVWPLLIGTEPDKQLAPIALANLRGQFEVDFGQLFAGALVLTAIPMVLLLVFQRSFTQSIAASGTKE
jgi:ABC-type glycerol-3-phosphate transport system permease component